MELRWYQSESVDRTWKWLIENQGNPLIVLPTGAGKSIVIAELAKRTLAIGKRVIALAHRKELIVQNAEEMRGLIPGVQVGIYSAGLDSRETEADIVCAGIQSIYKKAGEFGARSLVLVDEAHLVNLKDAGMYRQFLSDLQEINPKSRIVGLTATPYRTDDGELAGSNSLFSAISFEANVGQLIAERFLCPITSTPGESSIDTSKLKVRAGEFIQAEMESAFSEAGLVQRACREIVAKSQDRKSILVFCAGVQHAETVATLIEAESGQRVGLVTGSTSDLERGAVLESFKAGELRWLVNVDVLTTGFNARRVDCIAVLRATCSPGLFAQICGRGFRLHESKDDCLILDFGENVERHGKLDESEYGKKSIRKKREQEGADDSENLICEWCGNETVRASLTCIHCGKERTKICKVCNECIPVSAVACPSCGEPCGSGRDANHNAEASTESLLGINDKNKRWAVVDTEVCKHHNRKKNTDTLKVIYHYAEGELSTEVPKVVCEYICLEHDGYAYERAVQWWRQRCKLPVGDIDYAIEQFNLGNLAPAISFQLKKENGFLKPEKFELGEIPEPVEQTKRRAFYDWESGEPEPLDFELNPNDSEVPF